MSDIGTIFGFLGGTVVAIPGGYKVLQYPKPDRVFKRLSDAKWFLTLRWCEQFTTPAGVLNLEGQLSFCNAAVMAMGEDKFLPPEHRQPIFNCCLSLPLGETTIYANPPFPEIQIMAIEIDQRFGRVALVRYY
ncbi:MULTISPECIES: hypothetical protein [Arthrospira]|uniref:Uncharacterized protein n=2 Tax=Limnospira platensis TaxID=118562 RepID=A0A5M3T3J7_LIMPL|nr:MULTISPECIES: hypothetical protein [Arthrospira]AMW31831.1 hypothetical protein AP285_26215 [Arthrospira platensis YZ]KDR56906.1 hypothetical protein APPUASWS_014180 [Arthrospira platensis str. Paraca]MBD2667742.1 hypothetical protein [Arthrospira platensis FACHB-439]MBD2709060.1 hypothetical protein [Arthrospira platensis FACHB-835]MDT9182446.1 hypothetical protein [Limnospira sp. PMC 289.06]MDT9294657.1 hypothetical protein [Arthrospira platensis PCC 7345]MDT9310377.1 hypothetical prote